LLLLISFFEIFTKEFFFAKIDNKKVLPDFSGPKIFTIFSSQFGQVFKK
jgi:hypothetical protein